MSETSDIVSPILDALKQAGIKRFRMQSGKVRVRGGWMNLCETGTPDILAFPAYGSNFWRLGIPAVWFECKIPIGGRLTPAQLSTCLQLSAMGHKVITAHSLDDIIPLINELR